MAKAFSSWKQIEQYLKETIDDCLKNEVAETVKDELQTGMSEVVYSAGEPKKYPRRYYSDGGLGDRETMKHELVASGELVVIPDAERNVEYNSYPGYGYDTSHSLAWNIVKGYGDKNKWYNQPRDFIQQTIENMQKTKSHVDCMKDALKKRLGEKAVI